MSCTYAFNITGWSHVYIKDDAYAKNRFKEPLHKRWVI